MVFNKIKQKLLTDVLPSLITSLGIVLVILTPKPALSAERLYLIYGPFKFSLSVESLEIYAKEGKITKEFAFYASHMDKASLLNLRQTLQQTHKIDGVQFSRLLRTPIMEDMLKSMGDIFSTHYGYNGFYAIRSALILAAFNQTQDGWTAIDIMRYFPTDAVWIDLKSMAKLMKNGGLSSPN
ncbi:alpha/beta hydrolase [Gloeothece verrucosa]|uniref:DUF1400 domain-containing protein n=1 Tax=Gloeothece verrucosa (strain PCC 7822) TaxID=497965 RepID=E0UDT2_GLOV7|nr:alpha/beta hydrolase [Gloeothece verrucosa]ADN16517.1 protein of unknown function DUF1400 [Gloeothece verrucosa PCC 7822]